MGFDFEKFRRKDEYEQYKPATIHISDYTTTGFNLNNIDLDNIADEQLCFTIAQNLMNIINNPYDYINYFNNEKFMKNLKTSLNRNPSYKELMCYKLNIVYYEKIKSSKYFNNIILKDMLLELNDLMIAKLRGIKNIPQELLFDLSNIILSHSTHEYFILCYNKLCEYNLSNDDYIELINIKPDNNISFTINILLYMINSFDYRFENIIAQFINELSIGAFERVYLVSLQSLTDDRISGLFSKLAFMYPRSKMMYENVNKKYLQM